jgi:hypothetical protein
MEPEGSSPYSQKPATCPYPEIDRSSFRSYRRSSLIPRLLWIFRNAINIYSEERLAPRPTPKLEDHSFSAVRSCLFRTFAVYNIAY